MPPLESRGSIVGSLSAFGAEQLQCPFYGAGLETRKPSRPHQKWRRASPQRPRGSALDWLAKRFQKTARVLVQHLARVAQTALAPLICKIMARIAPDTCKMAADTCKIAADTCKMAPDTCKMAPDACKIAPDTCKSMPNACKTNAGNV